MPDIDKKLTGGFAGLIDALKFERVEPDAAATIEAGIDFEIPTWISVSARSQAGQFMAGTIQTGPNSLSNCSTSSRGP